MKREYDAYKIGFVETTEDGKIERTKKFYGWPQFYVVKEKHPITGELETIKVENAIQSWRSY